MVLVLGSRVGEPARLTAMELKKARKRVLQIALDLLGVHLSSVHKS